jgi:glycosyltransferase involved in cell wall biosynthesis
MGTQRSPSQAARLSRPGIADRPLRIIQVAGTAVGGTWFHDQVTGLARRGHTLLAVLPKEGPLPDRLRNSGIQVEIIPFGLTRRLRQWPALTAAELRMARFFRAFKPDVIHSHLIIAILACRAASAGAPRALRVSQVPGLVRLHHPALRWLDERTLPRDHLIIGSCAAIAREYQAMGARRVAVSYYGCDVRRLDPQLPAVAFRREFGLADDTPTVGMIAHMYRSRLREFSGSGVKGHEVFLDSAPLILRQVPAARLFVVGDSLAGPTDYRRHLKERARALGLDDRLVFTGHRADIGSVLAGLDVVVSPSLAESACYSMVEALLMKKAVVASNVGGLPDTVQDGETGLLIPPGDAAALAAAVTNLLADPPRRQAMGSLGRERCLRQFDIAATVAQVEELYLDGLRAVREGNPADPGPGCRRPIAGNPVNTRAAGWVRHD